MPRPIRTAGCGTWPPRPPARTKPWPPSSSAPPSAPRRAPGWPRRRRSCSASVALTAEPARRADRALAAAHANLHAGAFDAGLGLLAEAEADAVDDLQRARVEQLRGEINRAATSGRRGAAPPAAGGPAARVTRPRLARETYLDAWGAALVAGRLAEPGGDLRDVSAAARARHRPAAREPACLSSSTAWRPCSSTRRARRRRACAERWTRSWTTRCPPTSGCTRALSSRTPRLPCGTSRAGTRSSARHVELARASGALAPLAAALNVHRVVAMWRGDFEAARSQGVEEEVVKEVTGTRRASYGGLFLAATRGSPSDAVPLIAATDRRGARHVGRGWGCTSPTAPAALLDLGLGRYAEALAAAAAGGRGQPRPVHRPGASRPGRGRRAAAVEPELAADALRRLQPRRPAPGSDWAAGVEARSRALLSEGAEAETATTRP